MSGGPWTIDEARDACRAAARAQMNAENLLREHSREYAQAEEKYRVALAKEIIRRKAEEDVAWTVAPDLARGTPAVAKARLERDIAKGMLDAMSQVAWRCVADRKDAQRFSDWSQRREFAENYAPEEVGDRGGP